METREEVREEENSNNIKDTTIVTDTTTTTTSNNITSFTENNESKLQDEEIIKEIQDKQIKFNNKNIQKIVIKKSGIIVVLNSKKSTFIYSDSIVGCRDITNSNGNGNGNGGNKTVVSLFTCILKKKKQQSLNKEIRIRKSYLFIFEREGNEGTNSTEFINTIENTYINTLSRGNPKNRKIRILINPKSGKKESDSIYKDVEALFNDSSIQIKKTVTMEPEHAKKIGFKFNYSKYDTVVFISGDGLLHEFVNGLLSREDYQDAKKVPLALIPAGTGNGIACSLGLHDPMSAALAVIRGYTKPLDVCIISQTVPSTSGTPVASTTTTSNTEAAVATTATTTTKWCSILSLTFGLVSDVDIESEKYRSLGDLRLLIGAAVRILNLRIYKGKVLYLPAFENPLEKSQMQLIPKCSFDCNICDSSSSIETIQNLVNPATDNNGGESNNDKISSNENETTISTTTTTTASSNTNSTPTSPSSRSDINMSSNSISKSLDIGVIPSCRIQHGNYFNESQDTLMSQGWKCMEGEFIGVVASTVSHLASDFISSPNAHLSDGLIDLIFINNRSKLSKASLLSILLDSATGDHLKSDLIHHHKVKALILEPQIQKNGNGIIAIDGERIPYGKTSMENIRGCLNLICRSYH